MASDKQLKTIGVGSESMSLNNPQSMVQFANTLKEYIVSQRLYTEIKDKNYVNVEGWQFAGAAFGVFPVVRKLERMSVGPTVYRAEVALINVSTNNEVGYGVAICSSEEQKRGNQDEYIIASMAQTRATGKAFRLSFGWLMKMAGYEATPTEEMSGLDRDSILGGDLKQKIMEAKSVFELKNLMRKMTPDQQKSALGLVQERSAQLKEEAEVNQDPDAYPMDK